MNIDEKKEIIGKIKNGDVTRMLVTADFHEIKFLDLRNLASETNVILDLGDIDHEKQVYERMREQGFVMVSAYEIGLDISHYNSYKGAYFGLRAKKRIQLKPFIFPLGCYHVLACHFLTVSPDRSTGLVNFTGGYNFLFSRDELAEYLPLIVLRGHCHVPYYVKFSFDEILKIPDYPGRYPQNMKAGELEFVKQPGFIEITTGDEKKVHMVNPGAVINNEFLLINHQEGKLQIEWHKITLF